MTSFSGCHSEGTPDLALEYERTYPLYRSFADQLRTTIEKLCANANLAVDLVDARAKDVASVREKVGRNGYTTLSQVTDRCGIRIVARYQSTVGRVCDLLKREFEVLEEVHHVPATAQTFGYTSEHLLIRLAAKRAALLEWEEFETLQAEVQVRTVLQHAWAVISHKLDYKSDSEAPLAARRRLHRVAALVEAGDEAFDQYRQDIEDHRAACTAEVEAGRWSSMSLDIESLATAWHQIDWHHAERVAKKYGWSIPSVDRPHRSMVEAPNDRGRAARLLRVAHAAEVKTVGQLASLVAEVHRHAEVLTKIASNARFRGYEPFAIGPDVVGLLFIAQGGSATEMAATEGDAPYLRLLYDAAAATGVDASVKS